MHEAILVALIDQRLICEHLLNLDGTVEYNVRLGEQPNTVHTVWTHEHLARAHHLCKEICTCVRRICALCTHRQDDNAAAVHCQQSVPRVVRARG